MKKLFPALLAACALAACTSTPPSANSAGATAATPGAEHEVRFLCNNGQNLAVRFAQDAERAVLTRNGQSITLQQQPSASGFVYSNGANTIRGKGDHLTVEIGRMVPLHCQAQAQ